MAGTRPVSKRSSTGTSPGVTGDRAPTPSFVLADLEEAVERLDRFEYRRDAIPVESRLPGGSTMHRAIAKGVGRLIQGVLEQAQDQSHRVARTIALDGPGDEHARRQRATTRS